MGHSRRKRKMASRRFIPCRMGAGLTMTSRPCERKSQKTLGQKKPSMAATTWSWGEN